MTAICIHLKSTDPYFNLATEEYLLKSFSEEIFMLWRSQSAIVVGKHQNALAEINHRYVRGNNICIARRLSGGGTVFHDLGNLNYTFMKHVDRVEKVNYGDFAQTVASVLQKLGLEVSTTKHNDILTDGKKVSGSAEHVYKNRVLHHGTLLFNSQLDKLRNALNADLSRFKDKAVQSNRSEVANIADYLPGKMTVDEFAGFIFEHVVSGYADARVTELTAADIRAIEKLREEKYSRWDWIYGYSPKYTYRNELTTAAGKIFFTLSVEKGKIKESLWEGVISKELGQLLSEQIASLNHEYEVLKSAILGIRQQLQEEQIPALQLLDKMI